MLLALVHDADCVAARILQTLNISLQKISQDIWLVSGVDPREYDGGYGSRMQVEERMPCWISMEQI